MLETLFVLLVFGPTFNNIAEGCGRVPATPSSPPPPTFNPNGSTSAHESPCNATQMMKTGCLNGGRCFIIDGLETASCHCTKYYKGTRCEELADLFIVDQPTTATAGIAASIAVAILILIVLVSTAVIYYRKKRRAKREEEKKKSAANGNGVSGEPLMRENRANNHAQDAV
ncbi:hypothetical protein ACJMK2_033852 [Sinanodonta woodiana]|uniref:EGF-like domain-containing protein n=1 Tax=Sinanodonta woodiana TaxID=1069815 RepID=A0ABD3WR16_SINWO